MEKIKVIQYGVGLIGAEVVKILLRRKDVEIVGAIDVDKNMVGKDLGEVVGAGKEAGVIITDNPDTLFAETQADVVIHIVLGPIIEAYPQLVTPVKHGINVISAGGQESNLYASNPELAAKLDKLTKKYGVTVLGGGFSPGIHEFLILALTGACSEVRSIRTERASDLSAYIKSSPRVRRDFGIGLTPKEFEKGRKEGVVVGHTAYAPLRTICDRLGWHLSEIRHDFKPIFDEQGKGAGTESITEGIMGSKVKIQMKHCTKALPKGGFDHITIDGVPYIDMYIKPQINSEEATSACLINAIPIVMNAEPGIMTPADWPLIFAVDDMRLLLKEALLKKR